MNRIKAFIVILSVTVLSACNMFVTNPNPLIGYYRVSDTYGSKAGRFYYSLEENGYFVLVQPGGQNSDEQIVFEGVWAYSLSHFDFFQASGTINLHVSSVDNFDGTAGLALSYEEGNSDNLFSFSWKLDKNTGVTELELGSQDLDVCNVPGIGYSISAQEFERVTGIDVVPDEPVTPDTPTDPDTPETPENPDDTENPDGTEACNTSRGNTGRR